MNPPKWFGLLFATLFATFLLPWTARAACLAHPSTPGATYLGSFLLSIPLANDAGAFQSSCEVRVEVCVWLLPNNHVDYVLNVNTISFTGDCGGVDSLPFSTVMDQLAKGAVKKGTDFNYTECGDTTDVWVGQCAERSGSGVGTTFDACNTNWCKRRYAIICGPGGTVYQQLLEDPAICTGVSSGCERGCTE